MSGVLSVVLLLVATTYGCSSGSTPTSGGPANPIATTTAITATPSAPSYGTAVLLTATVSSTSATGSVTFKDGATTIGTVTLSGGAASYSAAGLSTGAHSITATYSGDGQYAGSSSTALALTVSPASVTASIAASPSSAAYGTTVVLTTALSSTAATGVVTFRDGSSTFGTANVSGGSAVLNSSAFTVGVHSMTAVYSGDANFGTATTAIPATVTILLAGTSASVSASSTSITVGSATLLTATVSPSTATGTFTFKDGTTTLGTGPLSNGVASYNATSLAAGSHSITVVYSGDSNYTSSTSPAITVTVLPAPVAYLSYTAFGDSIAAKCCVTMGTISQSSLTNNVATLTLINDDEAVIPKVGDLIATISGTANGTYNLSAETPITAVGGGFTGMTNYDGQSGTVTGTISFALNHANVASTTESGNLQAVSYISHLATLLHLTVNNRSYGGTTCADMATNIFATTVPAASTVLYTNDDGVNDIGALSGTLAANATKSVAQFQSCVEAEDIFLTTPSTLIVTANKAAATATGWVTSTLKDPYVPTTDIGGGIAPSFEMMSDTNGSTFTATVSGTAVAVGYEITPSSTGTASVSIDGGAAQTITSVPTCLATTLNSVSLVRSGSTVTATGSLSGLGTNAWVLVQGASDVSFNGAFVVQTLAGNTATWTQNNAASATATANVGFDSCAMSQTTFGRVFSPQVLLVSGLSSDSHTVKITVTSATGPGNYIYIDYIAGNQAVNTVGGPTLARTGVERTKDRRVPDSVSQVWDAAVHTAVNTVSSLGWNVIFADVRSLQNSINVGNISPLMYADLGATGTFTSGSTTVTGVSSTMTALMAVGDYIDDNSGLIPVGSAVASISTTSFTFTTPTGSGGALSSGTEYFNIYDHGVHPNNQGHLQYWVPAIYSVINAKP